MEFTAAERRIIEKARRSVRWSRVSAWILGTTAVAGLAGGAFLLKLLVDLHGMTSELRVAISGPSVLASDPLLLVMYSAVAKTALCLFAGIDLALCLWVFRYITAERRLLLKLASGHEAMRTEPSCNESEASRVP